MRTLTMKEVVEELMISDLGTARDSFNYILILDRAGDNELKSYQVCVENDEDFKDKVAYVSEYDLFTDDVGKTWDIEDFDLYKQNATVVAISDVEEV